MAPRFVALGFAAAALVVGVLGGVARLGLGGIAPEAAAWHGALMVSGFLGTVVSLERAIALGTRWAFAAPLASGLGTLAILVGFHGAGLALWIAAPVALAASSLAIVRKQPAAHTVLLTLAAASWGVGNLAFALGAAGRAPTWWFTFLVLTTAAERLELTRLVRRADVGPPLFSAVVILLLAGAVFGAWHERAGAELFGVGLMALAAWLANFDLARRTVRMDGLPRYAAVALLAGYAWLAVSGFAWALLPGSRDLALHGLALGFVFSMIFAHAPVIVPVVARTPVIYTPWLYAPLALLHSGLLLRVIGPAFDSSLRLAGGIASAAAIAIFAGTIGFAAAARGPLPRMSVPRAHGASDPLS